MDSISIPNVHSGKVLVYMNKTLSLLFIRSAQ